MRSRTATLSRFPYRLIGPALLPLLLLTAGELHAGLQTQSAYCAKFTDGSGYCHGTFAGFRNSANPGNFIEFSSGGIHGRYMYASFNGQYFSCQFHSQPMADEIAGVESGSSSSLGRGAQREIWEAMMSSNGFFSFSWSSLGICSINTVSNGSQYHSY